MKNHLWAIFRSFFIVFTAVTMGNGIFYYLFYPDAQIDKSIFLSIFAASVLATLPQLILITRKEPGKKSWMIRRILHALLMCAVIVWMATPQSVLQWITLIAIIAGTYVLVEFSAYRKYMSEADEINQMLKDYNKDEETENP